jgi:hypothetical protein
MWPARLRRARERPGHGRFRLLQGLSLRSFWRPRSRRQKGTRRLQRCDGKSLLLFWQRRLGPLHKNIDDARSWLVSASRIYPPRKNAYYAQSLRDLGYLPIPAAEGRRRRFGAVAFSSYAARSRRFRTNRRGGALAASPRACSAAHTALRRSREDAPLRPARRSIRPA